MGNIKSAAILGAGTMGGGIAMAFADAGLKVTLIDVSADGLKRGLATIRKNYERSVERGRLSADDLEPRMALIQGATNTFKILEHFI